MYLLGFFLDLWHVLFFHERKSKSRIKLIFSRNLFVIRFIFVCQNYNRVGEDKARPKFRLKLGLPCAHPCRAKGRSRAVVRPRSTWAVPLPVGPRLKLSCLVHLRPSCPVNDPFVWPPPVASTYELGFYFRIFTCNWFCLNRKILNLKIHGPIGEEMTMLDSVGYAETKIFSYSKHPIKTMIIGFNFIHFFFI